MGRGIENTWNKIPRELEEKELEAGETQKDIFPWKRKGGWGAGERRGKKHMQEDKSVWSQEKSPHKGFFLEGS